MGIFSANQSLYAEHGIATFPLKDDKTPAVQGWNRIGLLASEKLALKFTKADGLGFVTNKRNGITVVDVDTTDQSVLAESISRHGETPIIVRTASGKFHQWYRANDERRRIRPFGELPIDLLGDGGLVVAPPTMVSKGSYQFVQGSLHDIVGLPVARGLDVTMYKSQPVAVIANDNEPPLPDFMVPDGYRGTELWRLCMRSAHNCAGFDMLLNMARKFNEERCAPPMADDRVVSAAASAWRYTERCLNRFGQHGSWLPTNEVNRLIAEPNTLLLLTYLRANNGPDASFMISNGLVEGQRARLRMNLRALRAARLRLIELGYVYEVRPAMGGLHKIQALYRWCHKNFRVA